MEKIPENENFYDFTAQIDNKSMINCTFGRNMKNPQKVDVVPLLHPFLA